ncbi:MAG: hypothetical protein ACE5H9_05180 [Anaerolineae bacterium]
MSALRESWSNAPGPRRLLLIVAILVIPCLCILAVIRIVRPLLPGDGGTPAPATDTPVAILPTDTPAALPGTGTPVLATDTATPVVVPTEGTPEEATATPPAGATATATTGAGPATATSTPDISTHTPIPTATPRSDLPDTGGVLSPEAAPILTWVGMGLLLLLLIGALRRLRRPV